MHVRCPQCHNPIELIESSELEEIPCPSCGSSFGLLHDQDTESFQGVAARTLGHFQLIEHLGIGGFGSVWKARDTELDRTVAIKIPRQDQLNSNESQMFFREARAAAQLRHPHIVPVHEVGREDGTLFIVSDYVAGANLKEWLNGKRLSIGEAITLCVKVCDALHHAHEAGVVHRDLKPGNIMVDLAGEPHVMDFGLAKREAGEITMTVAGQILGTPAYMPPEQARGEGHHVDRRGDVYSLGVILFELLTGELPFRGEKRMLIVQILKDDPPSPRKLNAHVPRDLETICLKCLEKDPDRRYQSAQELADDLRRWQDNKPILARPVSRFEHAVRWCRRQPVVASLLALVIVVTVGGFVAVSWQLRETTLARNEAQSNLETAEGHRVRAELLRDRSEQNFKDALDAVDKMLTHVGSERLGEVPGMAPVRKSILEDALAMYQGLSEKAPDDPVVAFQTAEALFRVGSINLYLNHYEDAFAAFKQAIELHETLTAPPNPNFDRDLELAALHRLAGKAALGSRQIDPSIGRDYLKEAVLRFQAWIRRDTTESALEQLKKELWLANASRDYASALLRHDDQQAEVMFREAIGIYERWRDLPEEAFEGYANPQQERRRCCNHRAWDMSHLAGLLERQGRDEEALQLCTDIIDLRNELILIRGNVYHWDRLAYMPNPDLDSLRHSDHLLDTVQRASRICEKLGKTAEAKAWQAEAVLMSELYPSAATDPSQMPKIAPELLIRGYLQHQQYEKAEALAKTSLTVQQAEPDSSVALATLKGLWGQALVGLQQYDEAEPVLLEAYTEFNENLLDVPLENLHYFEELMQSLGQYYETQNAPEQSAMWQQKLAQFQDAEQVVSDLKEQATQAIAAKNIPLAISCYEEIAEIPGESLDHIQLRHLYARTMQWDKASASFQNTGPTNWQNWEGMYVYIQRGQFDEFRQVLRERLAKHEYFGSSQGKWAVREFLRLGTLLPLEPEHIPVIRKLAESLQASEELPLWQRENVAFAMYRLGEFETWWQSLPEDSDLRKASYSVFIKDLRAYQTDPTAQHRAKLEEQIERLQKKVDQVVETGDLGPHWHNTVREQWWIKEAKNSLAKE